VGMCMAFVYICSKRLSDATSPSNIKAQHSHCPCVPPLYHIHQCTFSFFFLITTHVALYFPLLQMGHSRSIFSLFWVPQSFTFGCTQMVITITTSIWHRFFKLQIKYIGKKSRLNHNFEFYFIP